MVPAVIAVVALIAGVLLGIWIRANSASAEKILLEQRNRETADTLAAAQTQLRLAQAESVTRAGSEKVAAERQVTIDRLIAERDFAHAELQTGSETTRTYSARISQLEAELKSEREGLKEKLALLEAAKQTLANQFEALAGDILEKEIQSFLRGHSDRTRQPTHPSPRSNQGLPRKS